VIATLCQHTAPREDVVVAGTLDDRDARDRRERSDDRLQTPHRPGAGGVGVGEEETAFRQGVDLRGEAWGGAVGSDELGSERLLRQHHDVGSLRGPTQGDRAGPRLEPAVEPAVVMIHEVRLGSLQVLLQETSKGRRIPGVVVVLVVDLLGPEGFPEAAHAVGRNLRGQPVVERHQRLCRDLGGHQGDQDEVDTEQRQTSSPFDRHARRRPAKTRPEHHHETQAGTADEQPGLRHRVGIPDVDQHLVWIEQVVDRDQVEACVELFEEEILRHRHVEDAENPAGSQHEERRVYQARAQPPPRCEAQKEGRGEQQAKRLHHVVRHTDDQQGRQVRHGDTLGTAELDPEDDAQESRHRQVQRAEHPKRAADRDSSKEPRARRAPLGFGNGAGGKGWIVVKHVLRYGHSWLSLGCWLVGVQNAFLLDTSTWNGEMEGSPP